MPDEAVPSEKQGIERVPAGLRSLRLPNGMTVACLNDNEARFVYREIFVESVYTRHGIEITDGSCVLDVGANIGLFSLFACGLGRDVRVHAFEPSPEIALALRVNVSRFPNVKVHDCGLSDAEGEAEFTFYPQCSILSGFHADDSRDGDSLRAAVRQQFELAYPGKTLESRHVDWLVDDMLGRKVGYKCRIRPLSAILREEGLDRVHLLKVDAERSEVNVLRGLGENDWPRIEQVVLEVHEGGDGTLETVTGTLRERGFRTTAEQSDQLGGSENWQVYARRGA